MTGGAGRLAPAAALAGLTLGILAAETAEPPDARAERLTATLLLIAAMACGLSLAGRGRGWGVALALTAVVCIAAGVGAWRAEAVAPATGPGSVGALVGGDVQLTGTVTDDPRPRSDRLQVVLDRIVVKAAGGDRPTNGRILVWLPRGIDARSGDRLMLTTALEEPRDFGGFAYRAHLARQGIGAIGRAYQAAIERADGLAAWSLREWLLAGLNSVVPEPEAALGAGILLGVRSAIAPEINEAFAAAGLTHVVAISGWNIAIVAALVSAMARPLERRRGGRWVAPGLAAAAVGSYVVLTGASPSVVRAALMAAALLVSRLGGSPAHAASALIVAAAVMLVAAPPVLWDVGFQLSLLATGGLIWFGAPVERRLAAWPGWIREPVALTLAAQLTTLPVILLNFERLSLVAPLANVLVVPIVPLAMLGSAVAALAGGVIGILPGPLGEALAWLAGGMAWLALRAMIVVGSAMAAIPYASLAVSLPPPLAVAWYPLLALAAWTWSGRGSPGEQSPVELQPVELQPVGRAQPAWRDTAARLLRRVARPRSAAAVLVGVLGAVTIASLPDGRLHLTVLDVGQGDAILIETAGGRSLLVDGGPDPELTLRRLGAERPYFARRIDVLLLTHPHQDHVAGLVDVLERHRVGLVLHGGIPFENAAYARLLADAVERPPTRLALARAGQVFQLDPSTTLEILYPGADDATAPLPDGDINNGSVVALLRHGAFSALLTGDAEAPVESLLVARGRLSDVDLLKVGHHGSRSSTTPGFLAAIRPEVAVISAGADNEYGHPARQTLDALAGLGDGLFRTDLHGSVEVISNGTTYLVSTRDGLGRSRAAGEATRPRVRDAGSIGPWPFPTSRRPESCSPPSSCLTASWCTPRASGGWRSRAHG